MVCVECRAKTADSEHQSEKDDYGEGILHQSSPSFLTPKLGTPRCSPNRDSAGFNPSFKFGIGNQTGLTLIAEVRVTVIEVGKNEELKIELKVPAAVTESCTTQCCPVGHVPAPTPVQTKAATVPPLSHPQLTVDVTARFVGFCPLVLKSLRDAVVIPMVSTDCARVCVPYAVPARAAFATKIPT
jgi:hypothetical protein